MAETILTRKYLYDLVWSEYILSLSKRYNITDVDLRKLCQRLEIPVPPAGHWTKVQYGKKVKQPDLTVADGVNETIALQMRTEADEALLQSEQSTRQLRLRQIESDASLSIKVPERLPKPDPLVVAAKAVLADQKPNATRSLA